MNEKKLSMDELSTFCKKKGFVYQSSEIYGGVAGVYDYGHIGTLFKRNFENLWKKYFLSLNDNFVEIDTGIIMHENVFKASGHLENFFDPIIVIEDSSETFRADHLIEEKLKIRAEDLSNDEMLDKIIKNKLLGEVDYSKIKVENLNMMFPLEMGPKKGIKAYLRPETAQSPFVNFKTQFELQRKKLPMGLALIGKVFRNEIAPRNMLLRTREVEQAELQIFFNPSKINDHENFEDIENYKIRIMLKDKRDSDLEYISAKDLINYGLPKFYIYYMAKVQLFYFNILKIPEENFRFLELNNKEKAFYNKYHFDIEIFLSSSQNWIEAGGVHYRTDHDLKGHQKVSKVKMEVMDETLGEKVVPHVLELSFGLGRNIMSLLNIFYNYDKNRGNIVLNLPNKLSPYKVAVFPLMNKPILVKLAREIYDDLFEEDVCVVYDKSGSIGKRYARQDEIGSPYCLTIDYETIEEGENKGSITIRDRVSSQQKRVPVDTVSGIIISLIKGKINFEDL